MRSIENFRRYGVRGLAWASLAAVPVLAVAFAGPALSNAISADSTAAVSLTPAETLGVAAVADGRTAQRAEATGLWQSTTRVPYIPGPRSPYIPPGP